jgi:signal transduction histidine kinase
MAKTEKEIGPKAGASAAKEEKQAAEAKKIDNSGDARANGDQHAPEVVYRRITPPWDDQQPGPEAIRPRLRGIAPAITPLIIGFTILLGLISLLGYLSVGRMDSVSSSVLNLEHGYAARLSLLLKLRLALTRLDNEARLRQDAESRQELKPPFDLRLGTAREELSQLLTELNRPPLTDDPRWSKFGNDLAEYLNITRDLRRYSLEGFAKFRVVDTELDELLRASGSEQEQIFRKSEQIEQEARASIRFWSVVALLFGALVAAATIWEIQRRFREMRRSTFEARRERVFTSQLLESMVSAVAAIDDNDRIRSANAAFFNIFPRASIGASIYEKFGSDDAMKMLEASRATRVDKATYKGRWVCRIGDNGLEKTLDVYSSPLALDDERGEIVTLVDVTEAAEGERALRRTESLAAVGRATTQVAHEIRNPLGSIRLGVSMLRDSVMDKEGLNTIELVERGIKHLNKLVVDVTQFSRQKPLELSVVDLNETVDSSLDLIADRINDKNIRIERNFFPESIVGEWDADQLRQVFVNLIANAIDASPQGSPITISTTIFKTSAGDGDSNLIRYGRLIIADQGSGIDEPSKQRLFEPFFTTKKRGTGLGLAIVKQIVDQHGGRIVAESEPGKGTRFIIDLPMNL